MAVSHIHLLARHCLLEPEVEAPLLRLQALRALRLGRALAGFLLPLQTLDPLQALGPLRALDPLQALDPQQVLDPYCSKR